MDPDETTTVETEPTADAAPATPEPTSEPEAAPAGPWSKDLESTFADEAIRGQVDAFLRSTVQPHVTRLETQTKDLQNAGALLHDLQENPAETYLAITSELWGKDAAEQVRTALLAQAGESTEPEQETLAQTTALDPRIQEIIDERETQKNQAAYDEQIGQLQLGKHEELFHPLVIAHGGDIAAAYAAWPGYLEKVREAAGGGTVTPEEVPDPPAVIGSDGQTPAAPPTRQDYKSIDEAMDAFFEEQKSTPQPVGAL